MGWALKVLFERKTGNDAKKVSDDQWYIASKHLLAGQEPIGVYTKCAKTTPGYSPKVSC